MDSLFAQHAVNSSDYVSISGFVATSFARMRDELLQHVRDLFDDDSSLELKGHVLWSTRAKRLRQEGVCLADFATMCKYFKQMVSAAMVPPGTSVGIIAAQSAGEPMTQLTLNTFHFTGVGEKQVTVGMPRLSELIGVSRHMRNPCLTVPVCQTLQGSIDAARELASVLPLLRLADVVKEQRTVPWSDIMTHIDEDVFQFHQHVLTPAK
jgi:DNA-directed RNA polymerase beta' subunit